MTEVIAQAAPKAVPAESCPDRAFADDVARGLPTAVTLAARDEALAGALGAGLGARRPSGPITHQMCAASRSGGAAKNVLAIASRHAWSANNWARRRWPR